MRFMVIVKATPRVRKRRRPPRFTAHGRDGQVQRRAHQGWVLLALDGLHPSSKGARVKFSGKSRTVVDGPFTEAKELVAGFSILQVKSLEEAIEWVKRGPNCSAGDYEVEIRQVFEMEDFAPILSEEQIQHKVHLRAELPNQTANKKPLLHPRIEVGVIGSSVRYRSTSGLPSHLFRAAPCAAS
jgi:hypothetical protein